MPEKHTHHKLKTTQPKNNTKQKSLPILKTETIIDTKVTKIKKLKTKPIVDKSKVVEKKSLGKNNMHLKQTLESKKPVKTIVVTTNPISKIANESKNIKITKETVEKPKENPIKPQEKDLKKEASLKVNLSQVALTTKETILKEATKNNLQEQPLRKEIKIEKTKMESITQKLKQIKNLNLNEIENQSINNISPIIEQLELADIVKNPQGENTAILKDKINNNTETLKVGDIYQGIRLVRIQENEIFLKDLSLNKIYKKQLAITNLQNTVSPISNH